MLTCLNGSDRDGTRLTHEKEPEQIQIAEMVLQATLEASTSSAKTDAWRMAINYPLQRRRIQPGALECAPYGNISMAKARHKTCRSDY